MHSSSKNRKSGANPNKRANMHIGDFNYPRLADFGAGIFGSNKLQCQQVLEELDNVDKLGNAGETVNVSPRHFRNHLMPKLLAVLNIDKFAYLIAEQRKNDLDYIVFLAGEMIPPGDEGWDKVFPESVASGNTLDDTLGLPSDDSEDDDFNPNDPEVEDDGEGDGDGDDSSSDESDFSSASEDLGAVVNNDPLLELPSDDSEDDDFNPDKVD
ncbi:homeobox protein HAT3.1-like protein [Tanacetum coccineum]|uniref:Homeobox protein HAT3.1-like protein n=1 Tax=Tanacetum coccineum TaxID=301880 RepID=A0ABQ4YTX3_9ASTR